MFLPHVKICGITRRQDALACAEAGIGALGAVFYEQSPRHVSPEQARRLFDGLSPDIARVGVFVNAPLDTMIRTARLAGVRTIQMHGAETVKTIEAVQRAGLHVVKVLKQTGTELLAAARTLPPGTGILVECGKGALPGGNATAWDWAGAAPLATLRPFAIAGGLNPENLTAAARNSRASGFDASTGVESAPGIKDKAAIRVFAKAAASLAPLVFPFFWKDAP